MEKLNTLPVKYPVIFEPTQEQIEFFSRYKKYQTDSAEQYSFHFECNDGWFDILDKLFTKIEPIAVELKKTLPEDQRPRVGQIKEKFAGLRVYIDHDVVEMREAIDQAEKESFVTCEMCGDPGFLQKASWWKTHCEDCHNGWLKRIRGTP